MGVRLSLTLLVVLFVGTLALLAIGPRPAKREFTGPRQPVLVELFTSEGCSSCPPADKLLIKLQQEQPVPEAEIIILGEHVDYWNYIGWTDRFSSAQFSNRQTDYARNFNLESIYTPQMVVDGHEELNGADERIALRIIAKSTETQKAKVAMVVGSDNMVDIRVAGIQSIRHGKQARLLLAITEDNVTTEVQRGENGGRTLHHAGVVRALTDVGSFKLESDTLQAKSALRLPADADRKNLRLIAFLQEQGTRRVLGAAVTNLP